VDGHAILLSGVYLADGAVGCATVLYLTFPYLSRGNKSQPLISVGEQLIKNPVTLSPNHCTLTTPHHGNRPNASLFLGSLFSFFFLALALRIFSLFIFPQLALREIDQNTLY
jgi:hypothetical protein